MAGKPSALDRWKAVQDAGGAGPVTIGPAGRTAQNPLTYASPSYPRRTLTAHPELAAKRFRRA